jgi:hypothetical protein
MKLVYSFIPTMLISDDADYNSPTSLKPDPKFAAVMKEADKCVAGGGYKEGHSFYADVKRYPRNLTSTESVSIEHINMTLHYPEHPHTILKRGKK